jgi:hypothetical protein
MASRWRPLAAQLIWWQPVEDSPRNPARVIAQVLDLGTFEAGQRLRQLLGERRPPTTPPLTMPSSDNGIKMRTIVDLPEAERAQLDLLCRQRGLSRAEALRQALRLWLEQQKPSHGEVFGLWRDRPEGSLELQEAMRQEWDPC